MALGKLINNWRKNNTLTLQGLSALTGIDQALLSKYETEKRLPSEKHIQLLSIGMNISINELKKAHLADKIFDLIAYQSEPLDILNMVSIEVKKLEPKRFLTEENPSESVQRKLKQIIPLFNRWSRLQPLSKNQINAVHTIIDSQFTYESNRMVGNNLTYKETLLIIEQNKTITGKTFNEHLAVINHQQCVGWIRKAAIKGESFSKKLMTEIHIMISKSMNYENVGLYRTQNYNAQTIAPPAFLVEKLMEDFFENFEFEKQQLHPIVLATHVFERIKSICPFANGNDQVALLMMNFILLKYGYPITILPSDIQSNLALENAFERSKIDNTNEELVLLVIQHVKASLKQHITQLTFKL